jgi:hypothetical protein
MSYPCDIDEMTEKELEEELKRRARARERGLCDYCGRKPTVPVCRMAERHRDARIYPYDANRGA